MPFNLFFDDKQPDFVINPNKDTLEKKVSKWKKRLKLAKKEYEQAKERKASGLAVYKKRIEEARKKLRNFKSQLRAHEEALLQTMQRDNLKKIEGIGPKIEQVLQNKGISTFRKLSRTRIGDLKVILYSAGVGFHLHNPATWATQARLASANRWDDLELLQDKVRSNRRSSLRRFTA